MTMMEDAREKWASALNEVVIGATAENGGTRTSSITIGGEKGLPFMNYEAPTTHRPILAMEVWDIEPTEWPAQLLAALGDAVKSPAAWAKKCVEEFGAEAICLKLAGAHPDLGDAGAAAVSAAVKEVLAATGVPLIIWGCDLDEKDNEILPAASQAAKGEKCLIGTVNEDNYKTLVASCLADGHSVIGLSPIDINIAKQVNILVSEMGFPLDRIVMYPTTGALGYGIEYTYSIQERGRSAALSGDKMMGMPVICMVGLEAWRTKEARGSAAELPDMGDETTRGVYWETATAASLLQAGCDILVMRHPDAVKATKALIDRIV